MAKRAPEKGQTGSKGQTAVKLMFEELGWGPVPVLEHDVGTDLFVQVRDTERYELGLLLGAQVKSEKRYFKKLAAAKALETPGNGWTYYADQDDVKLWLKHVVPHIVVLYDRESKAAFWRQVTVDSIEWTEKGAHIWIPAEQQVNEANREALLALASSQRANNWEGSAWDGEDRVSYPDRLRFALVTPRVIAPHPNREPEAVSPEEAIASLMLYRLDKIAEYERRGSMPGADERQAGSWRWRFFDALRLYVDSGPLDQLQDRLKDASRPDERSACAAVLMACLIEHGNATSVSAIDVAEEDDPVDRDWVRVQQARALYEIGQLEECAEIALSVAALRATHPDDPTAQAISAGALNLLFEIGWSSQHFEPMVRTNDNAPTWWRAQQRAWGLGAVLARTFEQWIGGSNRTAGRIGTAQQRLRSVALMSGISGDSVAWRQATSELAKFELAMSDRSAASTEYAEPLRRLCAAGDSKAIESTVRRLVADGPCDAARIAAHEVSLDSATRTSMKASIALVSSSGDVVAPEDADRHAAWALGVLGDPTPVAHLSGSTAWVQRDLVRLINRVWPALSADGRNLVVVFLGSMAPVGEQLVADEYARLIPRVAPDLWSRAAIEAIGKRVEGWDAPATTEDSESETKQTRAETTPYGDNWQLGDAWRSLLAATGNDRARSELILEATVGDDRALLALDDLAALPAEEAAKIIERLDEAVRTAIAEAAAGWSTIGMLNYGSALVAMNLWFPQHARWDRVYDLLDDRSGLHHQTGALAVLASDSATLPDEVIRLLVPHLEELAVWSSPQLPPPFQQPQALAKQALASLRPRSYDMVALAKTMAAGRQGRREVAWSIGKAPTEADVAMLTALVYDPDTGVAEAAARGMARALANGVVVEVVQPVLEDLLSSTGSRLARVIAIGLARPGTSPEARDLLRTLAAHPSAQIRAQVSAFISTTVAESEHPQEGV